MTGPEDPQPSQDSALERLRARTAALRAGAAGAGLDRSAGRAVGPPALPGAPERQAPERRAGEDGVGELVDGAGSPGVADGAASEVDRGAGVVERPVGGREPSLDPAAEDDAAERVGSGWAERPGGLEPALVPRAAPLRRRPGRRGYDPPGPGARLAPSAPTPASAPTTAVTTPARPGVGNGVLALLVAVLAVGLALLVTFGLVPLRRDNQHANSRLSLIATVAQAARQQTVNYLTFNYHDVAAYAATLAENSVGVFHQQSLNAAAELAKQAVPDASTSSANVLSVAVVSATPTVASALVIVDNPVNNKADPAGRVNHYRLELDLAYVHGRWLLSNLTVVP